MAPFKSNFHASASGGGGARLHGEFHVKLSDTDQEGRLPLDGSRHRDLTVLAQRGAEARAPRVQPQPHLRQRLLQCPPVPNFTLFYIFFGGLPAPEN